VASVAKDFGAKDGHDFHQVGAKLLHWGLSGVALSTVILTFMNWQI
jgi:hypothetical protein